MMMMDDISSSKHLEALRQRVESFLQEKHPGCTFLYGPKTNGDHEGYQVTVKGETKKATKYFVKLQTFRIEDVFGYHLLRKLGVGPQEIYFFPMKEPRSEGTIDVSVVTSDVATESSPLQTRQQMADAGKLGKTMWNTITYSYVHQPEEVNTAEYNSCTRSYMYMLMICCLMALCDIPSNTDNWGWINDFELKIYDFSILTLPAFHTIHLTKNNMQTFWEDHIRPSSSKSFERVFSHFAKDETHLFHHTSYNKLRQLIDEARDETILWMNTSQDTVSWRTDFSFLGKSMAMLDDFIRYHKVVCCCHKMINKILNE